MRPNVASFAGWLLWIPLVTACPATKPQPTEPDSGGPPPIECHATAPASCPNPSPVYSNVQPIFQQHCVPCHAPSINGPWPLDSYGHIADWKDEIRDRLVACAMPPPDAGSELPDEDRQRILEWLRCDLPQ